MKLRSGDMAYCVVPPGFERTFHLRFCTIREGGRDDMSPTFAPDHSIQDLLFCEWFTTVEVRGRTVRACWMTAAWLRPVGGRGIDVSETTVAPITTIKTTEETA